MKSVFNFIHQVMSCIGLIVIICVFAVLGMLILSLGAFALAAVLGVCLIARASYSLQEYLKNRG